MHWQSLPLSRPARQSAEIMAKVDRMRIQGKERITAGSHNPPCRRAGLVGNLSLRRHALGAEQVPHCLEDCNGLVAISKRVVIREGWASVS
jgi:hypothetical protein